MNEDSKTLSSVKAMMDLSGKVAIITGGAGLLGMKHAQAIAEMGGIPVLVDIKNDHVENCARNISKDFQVNALGMEADITQIESVKHVLSETLHMFNKVDILINNAANNPKVEGNLNWSRLENFPLDIWYQDLAVGLTGAFLCSQVIGSEMARQGQGVILNIASDLSVIAPDQRIYRHPGLPEEQQPVKPVTYSVVKTGLLGLTRYLATYWAGRGVRVNALSPGGVYDHQPHDFVERLTHLIPLGRMAHQDEYKAAVVFLVSEASSYMTGSHLVIDGGRTCW